MQKESECFEKAKYYVNVAQHILTTTYPVVKEPKVLLSSLENVFLAATNALGALLYGERTKKTIPPFHNTFDSKFNMFQHKIVEMYEFDESEYMFMQKLKDLLLFHKQSPVEFSRSDDFVMCDEEYNIEKLTVQRVQDYIQLTRKFMVKTQKILKGEVVEA